MKWNILPRLQYTARALSPQPHQRVPVTNPDGSSNPIPSGRQEIKAASETALNGMITGELAATLGYRLHRRAGSPASRRPLIVVGNRVQLVPYNQVSLWNKYQINPMWAAAVGVIYFGDSTRPRTTPSGCRASCASAAVYLKINEQWRAQLNVENIFNKGYWASADGNSNISPGASRTFEECRRPRSSS